ncbi:MAG: hypothetical protein FWC71_11000 [Defluviitaleaceae bacterium]|nr:hypothetical protein [Defluviitaleaceae bacterium]
MKKLATLLLLFFLAGCAAIDPPIVGSPRGLAGDAVPVYAAAEAPEPRAAPVLFAQAGRVLGMHEPPMGTLLGTWQEPDAFLSPRQFNEATQEFHAIFTHEIVLGQDLPLAWILQVMALNAMPLFILHDNPELTDDILPVEQLTALAQALGNYRMPMFLVFFPQTSNPDIRADEFVSAFRLARIIFRVYAPQVAFVWVPPGGSAAATPAHAFYPGHDMVDWVGIPALQLRPRDAAPQDLSEEIRPFYEAFHRYKPIMILPLGISHFSRAQYRYYMGEAAADIRRFYEALPAFPRVGAVVYRDLPRFGANWDDLSITRECEIREAYVQAISNAHFISRLVDAAYVPHRLPGVDWVRSAFHGYVYGGRFFVDIETIRQELDRVHRGDTVEINGRSFVDINLIPHEIRLHLP